MTTWVRRRWFSSAWETNLGSKSSSTLTSTYSRKHRIGARDQTRDSYLSCRTERNPVNRGFYRQTEITWLKWWERETCQAEKTTRSFLDLILWPWQPATQKSYKGSRWRKFWRPQLDFQASGFWLVTLGWRWSSLSLDFCLLPFCSLPFSPAEKVSLNVHCFISSPPLMPSPSYRKRGFFFGSAFCSDPLPMTDILWQKTASWHFGPNYYLLGSMRVCVVRV